MLTLATALGSLVMGSPITASEVVEGMVIVGGVPLTSLSGGRRGDGDGRSWGG